MKRDAIVVGAGILGLSAAAELARRGQRVLVLDQHEIPNRLGSSSGETRVIRTAYFEHPNYVYLAQRAWILFEVLGRKTGDKLIHRTGGLYVGKPDSALIAGSIQAATAHGLEYRLGGDVTLSDYRGAIAVPEGYTVFWDRNCGVLYADRSLAALIRWCRGAGVEFQAENAVTDWQADESSVAVRTKTDTYEASALVICGGPWAGRLLGDGVPSLRVTRQIVGFTTPPAATYAAPGFPVTCVETDEGDIFYTLPACATGGAKDGRFKIGDHRAGVEVNPDSADRAPTSADRARLQAALDEFLPGAGTIDEVEVGLYTMSPDGHFIVDVHPRHNNVVYAAGGSGHAFKFGPVIGEALADLVLRGTTDLPIGFLRASRFGRSASA